MKRFFTLILFFFSFVMICCSQNSGFISQNNEEFAKTIHKKGVQLVDVRTPQEYAAGHIPGAINIDVRGTDFDTNVAKLKKTKPVAVYCKGVKWPPTSWWERGLWYLNLTKGSIIGTERRQRGIDD